MQSLFQYIIIRLLFFCFRGLPIYDLRSNLGTTRKFKNGTSVHSRPELVYAEDLPGANYRGPKVGLNVSMVVDYSCNLEFGVLLTIWCMLP